LKRGEHEKEKELERERDRERYRERKRERERERERREKREERREKRDAKGKVTSSSSVCHEGAQTCPWDDTFQLNRSWRSPFDSLAIVQTLHNYTTTHTTRHTTHNTTEHNNTRKKKKMKDEEEKKKPVVPLSPPEYPPHPLNLGCPSKPTKSMRNTSACGCCTSSTMQASWSPLPS